MPDVNGTAETLHNGAKNIVDAFIARLKHEKVPHHNEAGAALANVLKDAPADMQVGQNAINEAVAHYKGKVSVEGVKGAFTNIVDKALVNGEAITEEAKTPLKAKLNEQGLFEAIGGKITEAANSTVGFFRKLIPTQATYEFNGRPIKNWGWADGVARDFSKETRSLTGIALRTVGTVGAGGLLISASKDAIFGRPVTTNDNNPNQDPTIASNEKEYHYLKALMKTAAAVGIGSVALFNQTLGKEVKAVASAVSR